MFVLDGKPLSTGVPFRHNDIQYPSNWLTLSSKEDRDAIGITEVTDPLPYDDAFYIGYDAEGHLIPKDHTLLVEIWTETTSSTSYGLLLPSDWIIVRELDDGTPADPDTKSWRGLIRSACQTKINSIKATQTTDELCAYIRSTDYTQWPEKSDVAQPFASWTRNPQTGKWEAPVPYPDQDHEYTWNEATQSWDLVPPVYGP